MAQPDTRFVIPVEIAAYAAGIVDGEGWIGWVTERRPGRGNGFPQVTVCQTEGNNGEELCYWFKRHFAGTVKVEPPTTRTNPVGAVSTQPMWRWAASGRQDIERLLRAIQPFLIVKRDAARRTLAIIEATPRRRTRWSREEDQFLRDHWSELSQQQLADALRPGLSRNAIRLRARTLGLPRKAPVFSR